MELMNVAAPNRLLMAPVLGAGIGDIYSFGPKISVRSSLHYEPASTPSEPPNVLSPWPVVGSGISFRPISRWQIAPAPLIDGNHRWMAVETNQIGALGEYGSVVRGQLSSLKRVIWQSNTWLDSKFEEPQPETDWGLQYGNFRNDLAASGVLLNAECLRLTEHWLAIDAEIAVKLLAVFSENLAIHREALIQRALRYVSTAKRFLSRALRRPYQLGNLISSQRRWYLHHGSHPSGFSPLAA